ncbi:hypothetical protein Ancab_019743 [Ancistrocladus abbreviatus]
MRGQDFWSLEAKQGDSCMWKKLMAVSDQFGDATAMKEVLPRPKVETKLQFDGLHMDRRSTQVRLYKMGVVLDNRCPVSEVLQLAYSLLKLQGGSNKWVDRVHWLLKRNASLSREDA